MTHSAQHSVKEERFDSGRIRGAIYNHLVDILRENKGENFDITLEFETPFRLNEKETITVWGVRLVDEGQFIEVVGTFSIGGGRNTVRRRFDHLHFQDVKKVYFRVLNVTGQKRKVNLDTTLYSYNEDQEIMTHNAQHTIREQRNRFVENSTNAEEAIKKTEESLNIDLVCERFFPKLRIGYKIMVDEEQDNKLLIMKELEKKLKERGVDYEWGLFEDINIYIDF